MDRDPGAGGRDPKEEKKRMKGNVIIGQSGGPTAVINSSLAGAIKACWKEGVRRIYGMHYGIEGLLQGDIVDIEDYITSGQDLSLLKRTPSSFLGTCRYKLPPIEGNEKTYEKIFDILDSKNIEFFLYNGGNDSMDTIKQLSDYALSHQKKQKFVGIPKTIDNDLPVTDHCPGYGSSAKYIATSMKEIIRDNESYGVSKPTICIVEIMGRHAGWLTAASALSRDIDCSGPDLIYLPEVPFDIKDFIRRIKELAKNKKSVVVAVSEGLQTKDGKFVCDLGNSNDHIDAFGHKALAGTAAYLAGVVTKETGLKSRYIEFSSLQRCAAHLASRSDSDEAYNVGFLAAKAAFEGQSGVMVTIKVETREPYVETYSLFDIHDVANVEKKVPLNWITNDGTYVSDEFLSYARPFIIGRVPPYTAGGLPVHLTMNKKRKHK